MLPFSSVMFWTHDHEPILCREVVNVNPYTTKKGSTQRNSMWEKLADTLNKINALCRNSGLISDQSETTWESLFRSIRINF